MKKIFSLALLLVLALSVASYAAAKTAPAPAAAKSSSGGMGITAVTLNSIVGFPSVRFGMGSWDMEIGGTVNSPAAGTTNIGIGGRAEFPMSKIGDSIRTYMAPTLVLFSAGGTSTITASFLLGAEYMFVSHLAIFADLTCFTLTSAGGTTTWAAGTNSGLIYTGARLYF